MFATVIDVCMLLKLTSQPPLGWYQEFRSYQVETWRGDYIIFKGVSVYNKKKKTPESLLATFNICGYCVICEQVSGSSTDTDLPVSRCCQSLPLSGETCMSSNLWHFLQQYKRTKTSTHGNTTHSFLSTKNLELMFYFLSAST